MPCDIRIREANVLYEYINLKMYGVQTDDMGVPADALNTVELVLISNSTTAGSDGCNQLRWYNVNTDNRSCERKAGLLGRLQKRNNDHERESY